MPGSTQAVASGRDLEDQVAGIGAALGLDVSRQVRVGRRIWGAERYIDLVLRHAETRQTLGVECKFQRTAGTAEEKIAATIQDIRAWPTKGLVVFAGTGFSANMRAWLISTGLAVEVEDLATWLELHFGL